MPEHVGRRAWLTTALMGLLALAWGACTPLDHAMVAVFGRSMRSQTSIDPYEHPLDPPEGAVSFSSGNFPSRPGEWNLGQPEALADPPPPFGQAELIRQDPVVVGMTNPVSATGPSLARGRELFLRFCAPCHGPDGAGGSGYIVEAGYPLIYPLISEAAKAYPDGYLYGMIRVGRGLMPAYGHRVTHFDRWNIVNYVRDLQGLLPVPAEAAPGGEVSFGEPTSTPAEPSVGPGAPASR